MNKENQSGNKKKILCIGPLPPPVHGSSMMTQIIKDSAFINQKVDLDWVNLSTSRKMEEIGQKSIAKIFRFLSSYVNTFCKLLTKRYDACYLAITCHGRGFIKDAPFALICKMFGLQIILHQHNKGMAADVRRPSFRRLLKKVYKDARVILLSWRLYPDIEEIVEKTQIRICPNGIPESLCLERQHNSRPIILFLSNLMESKGVLTVLDACQTLDRLGYDFECRFIGGETIEIDKSRFNKEREKRGLQDNVLYVGRKYGEEKNQEFSNADIFVFPTSDDCFPLVLLEAMQHSLPIVTTDIGGIPDIVDNGTTGIIIPAKNPKKLAEAVASLLDSPEKREIFGINGNKKYNSNFTLRNFEENILGCLTEQR